MCPCLGIFQQLYKLLNKTVNIFVNFSFQGFKCPSFLEPESTGKSFFICSLNETRVCS